MTPEKEMTVGNDVATPAPSKGLNIGLWVVQAVLALAFGMAGLMKLTQSIPDLAAKMAWVKSISPEMVRFIGTSELLGAIGLVVPALTRIKPGLTSLAAAGLVVVMVLAAGFHATHNDLANLPPSIVLGSLSAFVAWGRFKKAPIAARS